MDITRDVTTMHKAGKAVADIRREVDAKYGGSGVPTPTPRPK